MCGDASISQFVVGTGVLHNCSTWVCLIAYFCSRVVNGVKHLCCTLSQELGLFSGMLQSSEVWMEIL